MLGQGLPSAPSPDYAGAIPTPAMSPGRVDLSLLGEEKGGSPAAQLLQGDLLSPQEGHSQLGRPGGQEELI